MDTDDNIEDNQEKDKVPENKNNEGLERENNSWKKTEIEKILEGSNEKKEENKIAINAENEEAKEVNKKTSPLLDLNLELNDPEKPEDINKETNFKLELIPISPENNQSKKEVKKEIKSELNEEVKEEIEKQTKSEIDEDIPEEEKKAGEIPGLHDAHRRFSASRCIASHVSLHP